MPVVSAYNEMIYFTNIYTLRNNSRICQLLNKRKRVVNKYTGRLFSSLLSDRERSSSSFTPTSLSNEFVFYNKITQGLTNRNEPLGFQLEC